MYLISHVCIVLVAVALNGCIGPGAGTTAASAGSCGSVVAGMDVGTIEKLLNEGGRQEVIRRILSAPLAEGEQTRGMAVLGLMHIGVLSIEDSFLGTTGLLNDPDPRLQAAAADLLGVLLKIDGRLQEVDLSDYLRSHHDPSADRLVEVAIRSDRQLALPAVAAAWLNDEDAREVQWKAHLVATDDWRRRHGYADADPAEAARAVLALKHLSVRQEWWIRLYVARQLVDDDRPVLKPIRESLANDPDPRIRYLKGIL